MFKTIISVRQRRNRYCPYMKEVIKMTEKIYTKKKLGIPMLMFIILLLAASVTGVIFGGIHFSICDEKQISPEPLMIFMFVGCLIAIVIACILFAGLKLINPNEAVVLTLFGKYKGTLKEAGFYFVNPFCTAFNPAAGTKLRQSDDVSGEKKHPLSAGQQQMEITQNKKISLKMMTLSNNRQKINDCLGNPIEISIAVIWKVVDTAKAVFNVDNFKEYLSLQCDAALREIVRVYPYDVAPNVDTTGDGVADEGSLRGSSEIVAGRIKDEIQKRVSEAGLEVVEARITYLAYAPEIAAAMLQRQQASAVVDARKLIVDGAVGMVQMALDSLSENKIVELDDERKAAMVSNLLVVLCGNHDAQPVVNSGSLY